MKKQNINNKAVIYQTKNEAIELRGDFRWSNEVSQKSNVQKMHIANSDKPVTFYSLDIILAPVTFAFAK